MLSIIMPGHGLELVLGVTRTSSCTNITTDSNLYCAVFQYKAYLKRRDNSLQVTASRYNSDLLLVVSVFVTATACSGRLRPSG